MLDWSLAECRGSDIDSFYPPEYQSLTVKERNYWRERVAEAKATCVECPLRADCLKWALDNEEVFGVWGGLTARERRRIQKKQPVGPRSRAW